MQEDMKSCVEEKIRMERQKEIVITLICIYEALKELKNDAGRDFDQLVDFLKFFSEMMDFDEE